MARTSGPRQTRRAFLSSAGKAVVAASAAAGFPAIVPASVFGSTAPSNRINVGAIGAGRISRGHDLPGIWKHDAARVMAVCDLDARRLEDGKRLVNDFYARKTGRPYDGVTGYGHYLELLANTDIDAVVISTPDHWHALIAIAAVEHRQGRVPPEAGVAHHRGGAGARQRRAPVGPDLPDWQPAAIVTAIPVRGRTRAQRTHRPAEDRGSGPARRPVRRRASRRCPSRTP